MSIQPYELVYIRESAYNNRYNLICPIRWSSLPGYWHCREFGDNKLGKVVYVRDSVIEHGIKETDKEKVEKYILGNPTGGISI
jgi:hypothetical protein